MKENGLEKDNYNWFICQ